MASSSSCQTKLRNDVPVEGGVDGQGAWSAASAGRDRERRETAEDGGGEEVGRLLRTTEGDARPRRELDEDDERARPLPALRRETLRLQLRLRLRLQLQLPRGDGSRRVLRLAMGGLRRAVNGVAPV